VSLASPSAASLEIKRVRASTIIDNDGGMVQVFVRTRPSSCVSKYLDFLNREPDTSGLSFWANQMTNCGAADLTVCRINVSGAFFLSIEFQQTG